MKYPIKIMIRMAFFILLLISIFFITKGLDSTTKGDIEINFSKDLGKININYGANEDNNWVGFVNFDQVHKLHKNVNSEYIRVWVSSQSYRESTVPLKDDGTYDFHNLDSFINTVLKIDAIPFVVFAHAPGTYGEGHGENPPANDEEFADYVETVVKHYNDACQNNELTKPCDVNDWYFEIWNEPYTEIWWDDTPPRYVTLFNTVYPKIKATAPNAKVGGYGTWFYGASNKDRLKKFLQNSQMDFISIHHYGNILNGYANEEEKMEDVKFIHYDSILALRDFITRYKPNKEIEIIESEYNSDSTAEYMPHLDEPFTAAWYASALIWEIKSQEIALEMFYSGTSLQKKGGFGMWSIDIDLWPGYYMKKSFTKYNTKGSIIVDAQPNNFADILAVKNEKGNFITIVNKQNRNILINIAIIDKNLKIIVDLNYKEKIIPNGISEHSISNNKFEINLQPYEVKFLQAN